jgi:DNA polymerase IV
VRKPETIESLYLDFDGFFASVEQQARPSLRGRPVGVTPFSGTEHTICIAVSKEAKACGVKTGTSLREARELCPDILFQTQTPDLYVRAHHALIAAIETAVPVDGVCSIDEMAAAVTGRWRKNPEGLGKAVQRALRTEIGPYITASIGMAANRHLAKTICKWDKPNGLTLLHPWQMPGGLLDMHFDDVPGLGRRMQARLAGCSITDMATLWASEPKHLRKIWGSVTGERFWYLLHGYDVQGERTKRGMFGHGRVLPPSHRTLEEARNYSTFLLLKAARRMRVEGYRAGRLWLWLSAKGRGWSGQEPLPYVKDDQACLMGLSRLWHRANTELPRSIRIVRLGVTLMDLCHGERQLNLFLDDDKDRRRWEVITEALDTINEKYNKALVTVGPLRPPPGQYAGAKIAYTRIPDFRDFE